MCAGARHWLAMDVHVLSSNPALLPSLSPLLFTTTNAHNCLSHTPEQAYSDSATRREREEKEEEGLVETSKDSASRPW